MPTTSTAALTEVQIDTLKKELSYAKAHYRENVLKHIESLTKVAAGEARITDKRMHPEGLYEKEGKIDCLAKFIAAEEAGGYGHECLIDLLTESPGDTYSGRTNDSVRSYRDGQLSRARDLISKYFGKY
jgi:hypothetical protein